MSTLENMRRSLAAMRLYDLSPESLISAELAAYAAAFGVLEELLREIRDDAFVQTAGGAALRRWERLVGLPGRGDIGAAARRELVLYRMSVAPFDFTAEKMPGSVRAAGIEAEITEDPDNERLLINSLSLIDPTLTLDIACGRLERLLPAHLDWELEFGLTDWDGLDGLGLDWDGFDALDCPFDGLDNRMQELMGN